jgi:RNA methyltransferase, TrmH family
MTSPRNNSRNSSDRPSSRPASRRPYGTAPSRRQSEDESDFNRPRKRSFDGDRPQKRSFDADRPQRGSFDRSASERPERKRPSAPQGMPEGETQQKSPERFNRQDEIKACGLAACRSIFKRRAKDIVRVYVTENTLDLCKDILKYCASQKRTYHIVTSEDLSKISGSSHHEDICIIAKRAPTPSWEEFSESLAKAPKKPALLIILEQVENPHNVGAIVRTAAHFGATALLIPSDPTFKPSSSLLRTAEGGWEYLPYIPSPDLSTIAVQLRKAGFQLLATDSKAKDSLYEEELLSPRLAIILGNESKGLSATAKKMATACVKIPGAEVMDSLNVSVASAIVISEYWRQFGTPS